MHKFLTRLHTHTHTHTHKFGKARQLHVICSLDTPNAQSDSIHRPKEHPELVFIQMLFCQPSASPHVII